MVRAEVNLAKCLVSLDMKSQVLPTDDFIEKLQSQSGIRPKQISYLF